MHARASRLVARKLACAQHMGQRQACGARPVLHSAHPCHCPPPPLQKIAPTDGTSTQSAHPARFSPDDKFSRERVTIKKRFGILPTQQSPVEY